MCIRSIRGLLNPRCNSVMVGVMYIHRAPKTRGVDCYTDPKVWGRYNMEKCNLVLGMTLNCLSNLFTDVMSPDESRHPVTTIFSSADNLEVYYYGTEGLRYHP
jgi:hypothetical protein